MTVALTSRRAVATGNGVTTNFAVPFPFFELAVYVTDMTTPVASDGSVYTTSQETYGGPGTVTFLTAPASGAKIVVLGSTVRIQDTDYTDGSDFPAETFEDGLDRLTMIVQELDLVDQITVRGPAADGPISPLDFRNNPNKLITTSSEGVPTLKTPDEAIGVYVADVEEAAANAEAAATAAAASQAAAAASASGAASSATAAAASQAAAATSATNAGTSATAAASSATAAANSATAANTSKNAAATSATTAAANATAAGTSAASATTAATNAANSATAAAASAATAATHATTATAAIAEVEADRAYVESVADDVAAALAVAADVSTLQGEMDAVEADVAAAAAAAAAAQTTADSKLGAADLATVEETRARTSAAKLISPARLLEFPSLCRVTALPKSPDLNSQSYRALHFTVDDVELWACGDGRYGQAANAYPSSSNYLPRPMPFSHAHGKLVKTQVRYASYAALDENGHLFVGGFCGHGICGDGTTTNVNYLKRVEWFVNNGISVVDFDISSGANANPECIYAIGSNGKLYVWGYNGTYGLGDGTNGSRSTPYEVPGISDVTQVYAAAYYGTGFCVAGGATKQLWATGQNAQGAAGLGHASTVATWTAVPGITNVVEVLNFGRYQSGAYNWTLIRRGGGGIWSAGYNGSGQLGRGDTTSRSTFTNIGTLYNWTKIVGCDALYGAAGAVNSLGEFYQWGYSGYGQGGDGTTAVLSPAKRSFAFQGNVKLAAILGGTSFTTAVVIDNDNVPWMCGYGGNYRIPLHPGGVATVPSWQKSSYGPLPGNVIDIMGVGTGSEASIVALLDDGRLFAIGGDNAGGQLGLMGATETRYHQGYFQVRVQR